LLKCFAAGSAYALFVFLLACLVNSNEFHVLAAPLSTAPQTFRF
jgi:hypothetical protein